MRPAILLIPLFLAACGPRERDDEAGQAPVQTAELTGLYEGQGESEERSRICMLSDADGRASFGLVTFGPNGGACSGEGEVVRDGDRLRFTMAGDSDCVFDASITGTRVSFPSSVPANCSYYCSQTASLADESFDKTGGTEEDARRAADLAGDPLCG